jgi:hypothetical protein
VVPILKLVTRVELAKADDISEFHVARLRNGRQLPSLKTRKLLTQAAGKFARNQLSDSEIDDLEACAKYLQFRKYQVVPQNV